MYAPVSVPNTAHLSPTLGILAPDTNFTAIRYTTIWFVVYLTTLLSVARWPDPGVDSASNRNEYQESSWGVKGGRRVGLTTLQPSVSGPSRQNVGASTSHNRMGLHGLLQGYLYLLRVYFMYFYVYILRFWDDLLVTNWIGSGRQPL
jgi:hypothetical protein